MTTLQGKGVSGGVAQGKLRFLTRQTPRAAFRQAEDIAQEKARFARAQRAATEQLTALSKRCGAEAGEENALVFMTHAMLAQDEDFEAEVLGVIDEKRCCAEYAVQTAGSRFEQMFSGMEDAYMRARAADICDVTHRLLTALTGEPQEPLRFDEPVIVAADDLAPSETVQLDREKVLGFATAGGSGNSHTAILARSMGIPAVCGLGAALSADYDGHSAIVDGEAGKLILEPDEPTRHLYREKRERQEEQRRLLAGMRGQEDVTLDGRRVNIYCNIGAPEDVHAVKANDGRGIGLFRSEFLYLAREDFPDEETQFEAYRRVATEMEGMPVIIRTLDIGADKQAAYFGLHQEENPAMGQRAIRICLGRPAVFRTQLRAIYRASAYGRVAIMFPMIASIWEVRECRRACLRVMQELKEEGVPYDAQTPVGIMIETPAAVMIADELARLVDFFSVGTNDLTQYMLACDRQCNDLGKFYDPHHPAVLRALKRAADAAHAAGIWIGVCGELAADLSMLSTFLALGIDELSVSASAVLPLRAQLRSSIAGTCTLEALDRM